MGAALVYLGEIAEGRKHLDQVIALYNPAEHRMLTAQFGTDVRGAHTMLSVLGFLVSRLS
jgi:hypothetical protein